MYSDNQMLVMAIHMALNAHGIQLDKAGMPYILHPLHVMTCVDGIDAKIVAVLHDAIEDTDLTLEGLRFAGFEPIIIDAIDAISKRKGEKNEEYWTRVKANELALKVKMQDIAHNMSPARLACLSVEESTYLQKKYRRALDFLQKDDTIGA